MNLRPIRFALPLSLSVALLSLLTGCSGSMLSKTTAVPAVAAGQGRIMGGQQPVSNSTVNLYAVGQGGERSPATPLLDAAQITDANGGFVLTGHYTCPTPDTLVYLVSVGGNPGFATGTNNTYIALFSALGRCGDLTPQTFLVVNELTTVAAAKALSQYIGGPADVGIYPQELSDAQAGFALAQQLVNIHTGQTPGTNVPAGFTVPVATLNLAADILAACVNTAGGTPGDNSICDQLTNLTNYVTPQLRSGVTAKAVVVHPKYADGTTSDTLSAALAITLSPTNNVDQLTNLVSGISAFQPVPTGPIFSLNPGLVPPSSLNLPDTVDFGTITTGYSFTTDLPIKNTSNVTVGFNPLMPVMIANDTDNAFSQTTDCGQSLASGTTCTVHLTYYSPKIGKSNAFLVVNANLQNGPVSVLLTGNGVPGGTGPITLSAHSATFTSIYSPQTITLSNNGTSPAHIAQIKTDINANSGNFSVSTNCPNTVNVGDSCQIYVEASLTQQGSQFINQQNGTVIVTGDFAGGAQTIALSESTTGRLTLCGINPKLNVGSIGTGQTAPAFTLGWAPLTSTDTFAPSIPIDNSGDFYGRTISSGYGCANTDTQFYAVSFAPQSDGAHSGVVITNRGNIPVTGFSQTRPAAQPVAVSYDFPPVSLGYGSGTEYLPVANTGTSTLNFTLTVGGANPADFIVYGCTDPLAPVTSCTLQVTFNPHAVGTSTAIVTLTDSKNNVTVTIPISGTAVAGPPLSSPSSLGFDLTAVGATETYPVTITSTSGAPATLTARSYDPFTVQQMSCTGNDCIWNVTFQPTANGNFNGVLTATDSLTGLKTLIPVFGPAGTLSMTIDSNGGVFPTAKPNNTSQLAVKITNTGTSEIDLIDFGISTTNDPNNPNPDQVFNTDYSANGTNICTYGTQLNAGDSCSYYLLFSPTHTGSFNGTLDVITQQQVNGNSHHTVALSGTSQ